MRNYWGPGGEDPKRVPGSWLLLFAAATSLVFALVYAFWEFV